MMNRIAIPLTDEMKHRIGRVGVLYGGLSSEREISLQSGVAVIEALRQTGIEVIPIDVQENIINDIQTHSLDRVFIALHGASGEDGRIQAVLDLLNLPYTGSGVLASALSMDKRRSKQLWLGMGLPVPDYTLLNADTCWDTVLSDLGGSVIIKPAQEGSSIGMSKAETPQALKTAYEEASKYDSVVIAEKFIDGSEYTVSFLNGEALPAIRLEVDNPFYDYEAKYHSNKTRYLCPCGLSDSKLKELTALAEQAFQSLGCREWGRVDIISDRNENFYLLEVNTVPGMTSHSLVPMAAKELGISFEELVVNILVSTLKEASGS